MVKRFGHLIILLIVTLFFGLPLSGTAWGQVFYFIDQNGTRHFTNVPSDSRYQRLLRTRHSHEERPYLSRGRLSYILRTIERTAEKFGIEAALVKAVVKTESDFNPVAISSAGAIGLMQLMPSTAIRWSVGNPLDPAENIDGGVRYLKFLLNLFDNDKQLALAAYHAGEHRVERYQGIPPIPETQHYVRKVLKYYGKYQGDRAAKTLIYKVSIPTGEVIYTDSPERYRTSASR